ncbi:MAG: alpha/beta hydrolase [Actinobacteria bacterium]|nr:alpha/beta hydrolase [Actinomycetota bacterium]
MPIAEVSGWRLSYDDVGGGPPVLLAHGLLMDRTMFRHQVEALSDRWRLVTPDARNHGESEHRAGEPYTQWDLMEDSLALLDHLGVDRAVWGGVSQGGFQALRAALRHPDRVAGLVLIDTSAGPEDDARGPMYEAGAEVAVESGWSEDILGAARFAMFGDSAGQALVREWMDRWMAEPTAGAVERMHAVTRREAVVDRLGEIGAPAVVIHGEEDIAIWMEEAESLAHGLPDSRGPVRVPGAGHSSTVERPDLVTAAIERFLEDVWPP